MSKCGKQRYRTEVDAKIALAFIHGKADAPGSTIRQTKTESSTYRCPKCRGWHLTSLKKRGKT